MSQVSVLVAQQSFDVVLPQALQGRFFSTRPSWPFGLRLHINTSADSCNGLQLRVVYRMATEAQPINQLVSQQSRMVQRTPWPLAKPV